MAGIVDYFNFFNLLPEDQKVLMGEDKGISGLSKQYFYPDQPDGSPYIPKTRLGKVGISADKVLSSTFDKMLEPFAQVIKGSKAAADYTLEEPQSSKDIKKQKALEFMSPFGQGQNIPNTIQAKLNALNIKPTVTGPESDPQPVQDDDAIIAESAPYEGELDDYESGLGMEETLQSKPKSPQVSEQDKLDELFTSALQSAADAREGQPTKRKTLEDYKKEFSDATGIDTSGKVDKSSALMALGLALMQNKAGKGFNVGNMLSAVGEAGEKALPAFEKAKQQAKLASAKAGEYALGRVAEDKAEAKLEQEEMLNRTSYYIVPKGSRDAQGVAKSFSDGRFTRLNKFELNKLATNQEFNDKFEILDGSLYGDALTEMLKTPEAASEWNDKVQKGIKLFDDAPEEFQIDAYYYNAESGKQGGRPAIGTDYLLNNFEEAERKLQRVENDFSNIIQATTAGGGPGISFGPQLGAAVENFAKAFGIGTGTGVNPVTQAQEVLKRIQATNAADILQETGKTLSDNDRKLVARIVGEIDFSILGANEELLLKKLEQIYNLTVGKSRANLKAARKKLNEFGVDIPTQQDYSDKFSETDKIVEGI